MASGVAHDVNNALTPIVGYSDLLTCLMPSMPDAAARALNVIKRSGEDIARAALQAAPG